MTQLSTTESRIPARWLPSLRAAWFGFAIILITIVIVGVRPRYNELTRGCTSEECAVLTLAPNEVDLLEEVGGSLRGYAFFQLGVEGYLMVVFCSLAGLIFWQRSDTWIGYLVSLTLLFLGLNFFNEEPRTLMRLYPALQPFIDFLSSMSFGFFMLLFYLFPDGKFAPRWLGWVAAGVISILLLDPLLIQSELRGPSATLLVVVAGMGGAVLGMGSQVYRYRKVSNPTQRQQTKWLVLGLLSMFSMAMLWAVFVEIFPLAPGPARFAFNFSLLPQHIIIGFFPISLVISIMRYRLWDIDLVIRRTLQYTLLTGLLGLAYYGSVVVLQNMFVAVGGQRSPVVIVISTLMIAALFNPLRSRVQGFIDRRFYRQKFDTEQTLAAFAATARDEVAIHRLSNALLEVVEETMQPEQVSLWLKK
jgi:hypothetical protein